MKKIICLILAVILCLTCASCSGTGSGKSIVYPLDASPDTLDPQYATGTAALMIINNIFEGLVRYDAEGEIIPGIAEEWDISDDGLTYTFTLKEDTEWYCSSAIKTEFGDDFYDKFSSMVVTADDFVFACRRAVDPAISSPLSQNLLVISNAAQIIDGTAEVETLGVTAKDERTVVFTLTEKCDDFLERLTESEFMPCNEEFYNAMDGRYGLTEKHILCNGPFYISAWDFENSMTVKSNKYYAGEQKVVPSSVVFSFGEDEATVLSRLAAKTLTAAFISPESTLPEGVNTIKEIRNTIYGLMFNCGDDILKNANIRKAICSSTDRTLFKTDNKNAEDEYGFIPESSKTNSAFDKSQKKDSAVIEYSTEYASECWEKGISALETDVAEISILCTEEFTSAVQNQIQTWQKVFGISAALKVETLTREEINKRIEDGDYQIALGSVTSNFEDAPAFLSGFSNGEVFNYDSIKYKEILSNVSSAVTDSEIVSSCNTAEEYFLSQGIFYPLYSMAGRFVVSDDADGITIMDTEASVCFINAKRFDG